MPETKILLEKLAANLPGLLYQLRMWPDGRIAYPYLSEGLAELTSIPREELQKNPEIFLQRMHPDDRELYVRTVQKHVRDLTVFEFTWRSLNDEGKYVWLNACSRPELLEDGSTLWHGYFFDVTPRMEAQQRLQEAQSELKAQNDLLTRLTENIPGFLYQYQMWPDGRACFPYASEGLRDLFHVAPEEVLEDSGSVFDRIHPEDLEAVRAGVQESFEQLTIWESSFRLVLPKQTTRWVTGRARPEKLRDGSVMWHGCIIDETERFKAEAQKKKLEQQFESAQRLESLGALAGGIAHDFNNILMAIRGNAEQAQAEFLEVGPNASEHLDEVLVAVERAAELTHQMLAYAGTSPLAREVVDVTKLCRELLGFLRASLPKNIIVELKSDPAQVLINGDPGQLRQVIMNLVINGAEAIKEAVGTVTISIGQTLVDKEEKPYCSISVEDNGEGMTEEVRSRIFEPFFSTKFEGQGLGLAAVLGIIKAHRGRIEVESTLGQGTRVQVLLPAGDTRLESSEAAENVAAPLHWEGRVLLVDDEPSLRAVVSRMLKRIGCTVWTAEDGTVALDLHRELEGKLDLVLLDLAMPKMDGAETARELRKRDPELPIVLASGYSLDQVRSKIPSESVVGILEKPFSFGDLEAVLRKFLNLARESAGTEGEPSGELASLRTFTTPKAEIPPLGSLEQVE